MDTGDASFSACYLCSSLLFCSCALKSVFLCTCTVNMLNPENLVVFSPETYGEGLGLGIGFLFWFFACLDFCCCSDFGGVGFFGLGFFWVCFVFGFF